MHGVRAGQPSGLSSIRVLLHHAVRDRLDAAAAACRGRPEAGGILLGAYRGYDVEVVEMTEPGRADLRGTFSFVRSDAAHQLAAEEAWAKSGGTVTFVGEWHTHPAGGVHPSPVDLRTWRSQTCENERLMVFALAAPGEWGLFLVRPRLLRPSAVRLDPVEAGRVGSVFR